jgi:hypothetical protein
VKIVSVIIVRDARMLIHFCVLTIIFVDRFGPKFGAEHLHEVAFTALILVKIRSVKALI